MSERPEETVGRSNKVSPEVIRFEVSKLETRLNRTDFFNKWNLTLLIWTKLDFWGQQNAAAILNGAQCLTFNEVL